MKHIFTISLCFLALSLSVYGQNNYSMSFDGDDDYVGINDASQYHSNTITVSAWINPQEYKMASIVEKRYSGGSYSWSYKWRSLQWNGAPEFFYFQIYDINSTGHKVDFPQLPLNQYSYVSVTYDGTKLIAYVNGVGVDTLQSQFTIRYNNEPLIIGDSGWSTNEGFNGNIDDVQIWNLALSQEQIQQYMNCPPTGNEEGLLGCWNFDEGEGDTVYDLSDNGNNGTINGATYSIDTPEQNCVGCIDPVACNYIPYATEDDGSCDYTCCPGPGCCLDGQNWDWDLMGCVITNPTDSNLDGCTDLNDLMDLLAAYGICVDPEYTCGDLVSHDGYDYSTVQIGDQCWFSENCRYLPVVSPSSEGSESDPYYYVYDYQGSDVTAAQATTNYATYGVLYNWPAVMTEGICPSGWHIPSDGEFTELTDFLGGESVAGGKMKSSSGWNSSGNGSNSSGFTGLPGGYRYSGGFNSNGGLGYWWSASESGSYSWGRELSDDGDVVYRGNVSRYRGLSARCVRDYTDECGVLNGDNSTCLGCDGVPNSGLVYDDCEVCGGDNSTCLDECGVVNGDNSSCLDECGVPNGDNSTCFTGCGDGIMHEGYDYSTVQIGDQCWFSENCRYLPVVSPSSEGSESDPYYYVYDYQGSDVTAAQATTNYATYGVLYNWPAVMTEGICPSGWHIPSDGEWQTMEMSLGMSESEAAGTGLRGYPVGDYMKSTSGWNSGGNGSNSSGFNGLPGGYRYSGGFGNVGGYGYWWSASESGYYSWRRNLNYYGGNVSRDYNDRNYGFSARCVRD